MCPIIEVREMDIKRELLNIIKASSSLEVTKTQLALLGAIRFSRKLEEIIKELDNFHTKCLEALGEEEI